MMISLTVLCMGIKVMEQVKSDLGYFIYAVVRM